MFSYIGFQTRIMLGFLSIIGLMTVISASSLVNLSNTERDLTEINNRLLPNALLMGQMARDIVVIQQYLTDVSATHSTAGYQDAEKSVQDFKRGLGQFRDLISGDPAKIRKVDLLEANFDLFYQDGKRMADAYLTEGMEAGNAIMADFDHESDKLSSQMIRLRNAEVDAAKGYVKNVTETTQQVSAVLWTMSLVIFALALGIACFLTRHLSKQIGIDPVHAKSIAHEIAEGDLSRSIRLDEGDRDSLLHAIKNMQQKLLVRRNEEHQAAEEILRIKRALDNTSVGIMLADNERNIIYTNKSAVNALKKIEDQIRRQIPSFSAERLIGSSMDCFFRDPKQQADLFSDLSGTHNEDIELGDHTMNVVANPVIDGRGERIGTVTEWHDRTAEVSIEHDVSRIVVAAGMGDFSKRFDLKGKTGFLRELGEGLNQMLYTSESGLKDIARVLSSVARGNLTESIVNDYQGTFGELKENTNATVQRLEHIIHQIKEASDCIDSGASEIAEGNHDLSNRTEQQAASLEQTAASMQELTSTVKANSANAMQASRLADEATEIAGESGKAVGQVVSTMNEIKDASQKIEEIISVIDDIAFQTNILAFNASVEAARAGMQGHGFAVVAGEVRNLAQRAAVSAEQIKHLIEDTVGKIDNGKQLAAHAGDTMHAVLDAVHGVNSMVSEIAAASVEQSAGIEQVNLAVTQMDNMTQQNATLVQMSLAMANTMKAQTQKLAVTIGSFELDQTSAYCEAIVRVEGVNVIPAEGPDQLPETHKEHPIWDAIKNGGSNALYALEEAAQTEEPPKLAYADGDWEAF